MNIQTKTKAQELRFEVKIPIPLNRLQHVESWLKSHEIGFNHHHEDRYINSLYLDTPMLARYEENLSGISNRRKVRIRWYGDLQQTQNAKLEFKHRKGGKGSKTLFKTSLDLTKENVCWSQELAAAHRALPMKGQIMWCNEISPIIICRYRRQYLVSSCGQLRATLDREMAALDQRYQMKPNLKRQVSLGDYVLLELKTDAANERQLSDLLATCPLRPSRHSKYVNSIRKLTWY